MNDESRREALRGHTQPCRPAKVGRTGVEGASGMVLFLNPAVTPFWELPSYDAYAAQRARLIGS